MKYYILIFALIMAARFAEAQVFDAFGPSTLIPAAASAPFGLQVSAVSSPAARVYRIVNVGTNIAYVAYSSGGAAAGLNAVVPTAGNPREVVAVVSNATHFIVAPPGSFFSAIAPAGNTNLFITPGDFAK